MKDKRPNTWEEWNKMLDGEWWFERDGEFREISFIARCKYLLYCCIGSVLVWLFDLFIKLRR